MIILKYVIRPQDSGSYVYPKCRRVWHIFWLDQACYNNLLGNSSRQLAIVRVQHIVLRELSDKGAQYSEHKVDGMYPLGIQWLAAAYPFLYAFRGSPSGTSGLSSGFVHSGLYRFLQTTSNYCKLFRLVTGHFGLLSMISDMTDYIELLRSILNVCGL